MPNPYPTLCLSALFTCLASTFVEAVSPDEVRQANRTAVAAIRTAHVTYEARVEKDDFRGDQRTRLKSILDRQENPSDRALEVLNLARNGRDACTVYFDAHAGEYKLERQDLRDLDAIMLKEGLPENQRVNLTRTMVRLSGSGVSAYFHPAAKHLIVEDRDAADPNVVSEALWRTPLETGCVGDGLFARASSTSVTDCTLDERNLVCLTIEVGGGKYVIHADPTIGYRYRMFETYGRSGTLLERKTADDYRNVDGIPYPFRFEQYRWHLDGQPREHTTITVTTAAFNKDLPEGALELSVPAGFRVQYVALRVPIARTTQTTVIRVSDLPTLGQRLNEQQRSALLGPGS